MKQLMFFLISFFCISLVSAQQTETELPKKGVKRVGLQAGYSRAKWIFADSELDFLNNEVKPLSSGSFGFFSESGANNFIITKIGLYYAGKGSSFKNEGGEPDVSRFHYIQVPLTFSFRTPIYGPVYLQTGFGPYAGLAFMAKETGEEGSSRDLMTFPKEKFEENKPFNPIDLGIQFNAAVEVGLPDKKVLEAGFNLELGLWKIANKHKPDPSMTVERLAIKNQVMSFYLAYAFDLN